MKLEPGQLVGERYRLERPLGEGGMGVVWTARHRELDTEVALKFIAEDDAEDVDAARARFRREARAAAQLKSPHVAQIHDYGVEGSMPYIAMELLAGEDLEALLEREGRLSLERCTEILDQVCHGLQVAHDAGVVHRDLKPSNLFLARMGGEEVVKILDFGIAKLLGVSLPKSDRTKSGVLVGSPRYMSPEQTLGGAVGPASDLWSLGVVLFEMVTGQSPFDAEALFQAAGALSGGPEPPATSLVSELPDQVDRFFARALAGNPDQRFRSARLLFEAFEAAVAGEPWPESVQPSTEPRPAEGTVGASSAEQERAKIVPRPKGEGGTTQPSAGIGFAATEIAPSGEATTAATVRVVSAPAEPRRRMAALARPSLWALAVLVVAAVGWLVASWGTGSEPDPSDRAGVAGHGGTVAGDSSGQSATPSIASEPSDDPALGEPSTPAGRETPASPQHEPALPSATGPRPATSPSPRRPPPSPPAKPPGSSQTPAKDPIFGI